jgi:hypothetical protein
VTATSLAVLGEIARLRSLPLAVEVAIEISLLGVTVATSLPEASGISVAHDVVYTIP